MLSMVLSRRLKASLETVSGPGALHLVRNICRPMPPLETALWCSRGRQYSYVLVFFCRPEARLNASREAPQTLSMLPRPPIGSPQRSPKPGSVGCLCRSPKTPNGSLRGRLYAAIRRSPITYAQTSKDRPNAPLCSRDCL